MPQCRPDPELPYAETSADEQERHSQRVKMLAGGDVLIFLSS
jgi:hypothetical protein